MYSYSCEGIFILSYITLYTYRVDLELMLNGRSNEHCLGSQECKELLNKMVHSEGFMMTP